jgi:hypothetical protein
MRKRIPVESPVLVLARGDAQGVGDVHGRRSDGRTVRRLVDVSRSVAGPGVQENHGAHLPSYRLAVLPPSWKSERPHSFRRHGRPSVNYLKSELSPPFFSLSPLAVRHHRWASTGLSL